MLYYITLTQVCGLKCRYCMNEPNPRIMPIHFQVDLNILKKFLMMDPHRIICFYGGDPLYKIPLMEAIMDSIPAEHYIIQTNGIMLHRVKPSYIRRIDTLLVSIDGRPEVTDYYRGDGVYDKVLRNVGIAIENGFQGDLVARMAVSGASDIYREVTHLLNLEQPKFNHIHWQLDALWDYPPAQRYKDFKSWVYNIYNPGIYRLIRLWVKEMEDGRVLGIAPFKGIMWSMLTGENRYTLRCSSGLFSFAIGTDGRIMACPIAPEYKFNIIGDIFRSTPSELVGKVKIDEPCTSCKYYEYCGGRCLFANKTMLWGREGFELVCDTVKFLIDSLKEVKGRIMELIKEGIIKLPDIKYPPYLNSVEIIP